MTPQSLTLVGHCFNLTRLAKMHVRMNDNKDLEFVVANCEECIREYAKEVFP